MFLASVNVFARFFILSLAEVKNNIALLATNVFFLYQYTVIIFYSWNPENVAPNINSFRAAFPSVYISLPFDLIFLFLLLQIYIRFVDVSRHFPTSLPQHLISAKVYVFL